MSMRDLVYPPGIAIVPPGAHARARSRTLQVRMALLFPLALATSVGALVFARARMIWAPEGDSALHYKLMLDIAHTHSLPSSLPHYPANILPGGVVESMFPYAYTPLFHVTGAIAYLIGGSYGVSMMGAASAAAIAFVTYAFLKRRLPWYVASCCVGVAFLPPTTMAVFTHVYMEPMMLALVFTGAWFYYIAMTTRRSRPAMVAGLLFGLAVGTRQVALIYVLVIGLVTLLYLSERQCWRLSRLKRELPWLLSVSGVFIMVAAPFLAYLMLVNGSIGYADLALPGTTPTLAVDPVANAYIANITKPDLSLMEWISRYRFTLLYSERWLPQWYAALPFLFFIPGVTYLANRGGGARFYARLAATQLIVEMVLFAVVHGNDRYVIASRFLFYSVLPVGVYSVVHFVFVWFRDRTPGAHRVAALLTGIALTAVLGSSMVGATYRNYVTESQDLMSFRSRSYAQMGAWVNAYTPEDSVILVPRTYSAELTWDRDVAWVTFYGNAWVIDAITTPDPATAHAILRTYGVDYVLIADPPGAYLDRVPRNGMRSYLRFGRDDSAYFTLVNYTQSDSALTQSEGTVGAGLRLYRVNAEPGVAQ